LRHQYSVTDKFIAGLIEQVLRSRVDNSAAILAALRREPLMDDDMETIRGILAEELVENGLGPDGEPNERGRLIETAIDWLGHR
jgi:hypothetical protein